MALELRLITDGETTTVKLLSITDVLERIPVHRKTLDNWTRAGIFPAAQKVGGGVTSKRLWLESDVDKWIAEQGVK